MFVILGLCFCWFSLWWKTCSTVVSCYSVRGENHFQSLLFLFRYPEDCCHIIKRNCCCQRAIIEASVFVQSWSTLSSSSLLAPPWPLVFTFIHFQWLSFAYCHWWPWFDLISSFHFPAQFECPAKDGQYEDEFQCDKYYVCTKGVAEEKLCEDGLVFDPFKRSEFKCNLFTNVDCEDRTELRKSRLPSKKNPPGSIVNNRFICLRQRNLIRPGTAPAATVSSVTPTIITAINSSTASTERPPSTRARPTCSSTRRPVCAPGPLHPAAPTASARKPWKTVSSAPRRSSWTLMATPRPILATLTQPTARSSTSASTASLHVRWAASSERSTTATANSATNRRTWRTGNLFPLRS